MSSRRVPYGRKTLSDEQPSRADDAVITLDRVRKEFGSFAAVREAHFSIARGEFFAMLGPSGCGKTTTLKMIAGFEPLTSGRVLLEGVDVSTVPPWKRNVNTVFQHYALFPHMSVADNVAFGPRSKKAPSHEIARRVHHMLEVVRLEEFASRRPALLSGGQQQRVARARALVNLPSALLLDEPLAALDLKLREAMQLELKRIQREVGITFLFVTHDQGEALTMSDRIAVMSQGVVEQIGTPEDIYHRPASLFVAGFIGSANLLPGTAAGHDGEATVVQLSSGASIRASGGLRGPSQGDRVSVMLRPERLRATVVDLIFRGATARLQLALVDGTELVTYVESHAQLPFLRPGEQIWVTWDPGSAYLVSGWPAKAGATSTDVDQMDRLTADVAGLIDAAGAGSTVLVGHDWGGGIAWTTALERLRPLERLIIMNAPHPAPVPRRSAPVAAAPAVMVHLRLPAAGPPRARSTPASRPRHRRGVPPHGGRQDPVPPTRSSRCTAGRRSNRVPSPR